MTVKDFRQVSKFDFINIIANQELVETIDLESDICLSDNMRVKRVLPIKGMYLQGVEIEVE